MALAATPGAGSLGLQRQDAQDSPTSHSREFDRKSLCISLPTKSHYVIHSGETGFADEISRFYSPTESLAADRLIELKARLRTTKAEHFWTTATEGIADILGSQYAFISKRMQFDDEDPSILLPPIGEPESCLLGMSIYYSGGQQDGFNAKRAKYIAHNCPCAHMKHNKVLLIPDSLSKVIPNNPNALPEQPEGYLAIPLSLDAENNCVFGHFGVMWTQKGLDERSCSFAFLEMLLHGLEGLIVDQFVAQGLVPHHPLPLHGKTNSANLPKFPKVYKSFSTSLKPYARSLSHELRTPMQGVVGMLDVMFAQVQEAGEGQADQRIHQLFASLRESIEIVQDSARRAVEAADNVVHAYDMGMGVPDDTVEHAEFPRADDSVHIFQHDKRLLPTPIDSMSPTRGHKRTRSSADSTAGNNPKARRISLNGSKGLSRDRDSVSNGDEATAQDGHDISMAHQHFLERNIAPGVRQMDVREALQGLVNDMLRVGGRPESAIAQPIDGGEEIEMRRRFANGDEKVQLINWSVDDQVPETIIVEEQAFAGLVSRVLHNALKFTESGRITIHVRLSPKGTSIILNVEDTGIGIPLAFIPRLFKPFSKEDDGITRSSEGLGLGLMVAKGLARKLNGDLHVVKSETEGSNKGTEFQMRIPITPGDSISRPVTPYGSRSPSFRHHSTEADSRLHSKSQTPPFVHRPSAGRHSRNISNVARSNISSNSVTGMQSPHHPYQSSLLASGARITTLEVPALLAQPPDIITPPLSVSADHANVPVMLRTTPCTPTPLPGPEQLDKLVEVKLANRLPLSFLVVEDNTVLRRILVRMLKDMGYMHIHEAYDGTDAVRQMDKHVSRRKKGEIDYEIDVVLMDLWMPMMNGYQATERIRGMFGNDDDSRRFRAPMVLAITADVTDEATEKVAKAGMHGPLTKPYKAKDLERYLLEMLYDR